MAHLDTMFLVPVRVEAVVDDGGFGNAAASLAVRTGVYRDIRVRHVFRVSVTIKMYLYYTSILHINMNVSRLHRCLP